MNKNQQRRVLARGFVEVKILQGLVAIGDIFFRLMLLHDGLGGVLPTLQDIGKVRKCDTQVIALFA